MTGIQIDRIQFTNYRQYGTTEIHFDKDPQTDTHLFAFIAQNGTGKTTILKAITWCLYGKEASGLTSTRSGSKSLPLVNTTTLALADREEKVPVVVSFRFIGDHGDVIEFTRETSYIQHKNGNISQGPTHFTSVCTPAGTENTVTAYNADADVLVKQYFDPSIRQFYFFDGEKLAGLFGTDLKNSIYNIAQVNLLENTIKHIKVRSKELNKKLGNEQPDIITIQNELDNNIDYIHVTELQKKKAEAKRKLAREQYDQCDDALRGYKPVQQLQETREKLIEEEQELNQNLVELKNRQITFIQKYLTLLPLYPRICKISSYISQKEMNGKLPPSIDRSQILDLLNHQKKDCPLCGAHLDQEAIEHLKTLLDEYSISSATSNFLSMIIAPLENAMAAVENYKKEKDALQEDFRTIERKKRDNQKALNEVNSKIMQYGGESGFDVVRDLNDRYTEAKNQLIDCEADIKNYTNEIEKASKEIDVLNRKLVATQEQIKDLEKVKEQVKVLNQLKDSFTRVMDAIVNETKTEMQKLTWNTFSAMTWKKNTFGKISIDEGYNVVLYDIHNQAMNNDASGAEAMALAYAFTLSVHQVSGKNSPLVIDSPLGRVSDIAREKMATALLQAAKEKQIIMLFTPDEYSEVVQHIYEHHATVRQLKLSLDESVVKGVKPYGR